MGNPLTNDADHHLYARPQPGQDRDWVEVVDDGGGTVRSQGSAPGFGRQHDGQMDDGGFGTLAGDSPEGAVVDGGEVGDGAAVTERRRRFRFNPYLAAGWAVMALVLAPGLLWVTGILRQPQLMTMVEPGTGRSVESPSAVIAMQLFQAGPFILLFGLLGAAMLLACHGLIHALNAGRPAPAAAGTGRGSRRP
ncbi:hypothetical protein BN1051_02999 [Arthrobacter saudimassiliensis]|uniref:Uncharacterized protein n=1 Tax=Arthrobacter saudimassiliensis TaxID=1461584 RepID=A0A078MW30_9MICC|nr:hypothetical protein BN1051_02999 [Arthrobacter saudimassiliensis]